jgi:hypothetical protein
MMRRELEIVSRDGVTVFFRILWNDGVPFIDEIQADLKFRDSLETWLREGFDESVVKDDPEHPYDRYHRLVLPSHPDFLLRLGHFIVRQTGFSMRFRYIV